MNKYCRDCYDWKHPRVRRENDCRTCGHGCTVRGSSCHGCWTEDGVREEEDENTVHG